VSAMHFVPLQVVDLRLSPLLGKVDGRTTATGSCVLYGWRDCTWLKTPGISSSRADGVFITPIPSGVSTAIRLSGSRES
jgi:hypothetical protein